MHKDPGMAMLSVTALIPAVSGCYPRLPIAGSLVKALCLPLKPRSLPASVMVLHSGIIDGG